MFTPLRDVDVYVVSSYLNAREVHNVIQTSKKVDKHFYTQLNKMKNSIFRQLEFIVPTEIENIQYISRFCDDLQGDQNKMFQNYLNKSNCFELRQFEIRTDTRNVKYIFAVFKDAPTQFIIYQRRIKIIANKLVVYCI